MKVLTIKLLKDTLALVVLDRQVEMIGIISFPFYKRMFLKYTIQHSATALDNRLTRHVACLQLLASTK